jgi:Tfp pilus assembly protein PilF
MLIKQLLVIILLALLAACAGVTPPPAAKAPPAAEPKVDPKAAAAYEVAVATMKDGDDAKAEKLFQQMTRDFPAYSGPYTNLGIIYWRAGDEAKAEAAFKHSLDINANNAVSLNYLGMISRRQGQFKEAADYYRQALQIDPDYAYAHRNFGILLELYMGKLDEALAHYKRYQALTEDEDKEVTKWIVDLGRRTKAKN